MAQYPPYTSQATADATGAATITFTPRGAGLTVVTQVAVEMAGAASATCVVRRNSSIVCVLVATGDAAGGDPPIWLWPGDVMTVEWTGATAGAVGKATIFYDLSR
jgi:hypothetical protein